MCCAARRRVVDLESCCGSVFGPSAGRQAQILGMVGSVAAYLRRSGCRLLSFSVAGLLVVDVVGVRVSGWG